MGAFKGWQNTRKNKLFADFPNIIVPDVNAVYGFTGCRARFIASFGLDNYTNNGVITRWDAQQGFSFRNTSGVNRPTFVASNASFNNNPCVRFPSPSSNLIQSNGFIGVPTSSGAIVAVCQASAASSGAQAILLSQGPGQAGSDILMIALNTPGGQGLSVITRLSNSTIFATKIQSGVSYSNPIIVIFKPGLNGSAFLMVNGVVVASGSWDLTSSFGAMGLGAGAVASIDIAEVLLYSNQSLVSSENARRLSDMINSAYNVY